jgi:RHS repeat-associated protein
VLANDFWSIGASQFNGSIDEVAVYGTALTLSQIQSHYTAAGYSFGTPGPPTGVTAVGGTNQATVSWTAPSNTGTSAISGYTVTPHVGSTIRTPTTVSGSTTSTVITNLSNGSYTFTVVATNNSGNGLPSAASAAATVGGATYAYGPTILGDGPAAYWRLGDGSGVPATDNTGNGNTGTYSGGFTIGQTGAIQGDPDTGVLFDGNTGHVAVPSSASLDMTGNLSVEAWIKLANAGTTQLIINKGDGANANASAYELGFVPATGVVFDTFVNNTRVRAASSSALSVGQWYHLVGTRSAAGTLLLYIDGQLAGAANDGGGQINNVNAPLGIAGSGMGTGANLQPLNGTTDEVAVYPAVLTATQVQNHWQVGGYRAGAPTAVSATGGANQATVSWTAPAGTGGSPITGYVITPQLGTSPSITLRTPFFAPATPTSATVTNLSGGSSYAFTVSAITAYGVGAASTASTAVAVTGTAYPYASTVLANAPAGYWRLGEASGTLASDASGNGNNASYYGGSILGQAGAIVQEPDPGVKVDGLSGHVIVPNSPKVAQTGALSLETWVNLTSVASTQMLIDKGDGGTASLSAFDLVYNAGQGFAIDTFIGSIKASAAQSGTPATARTWYHVVGTRTAAGALTLYVNGSQVATGTDTGGSLNNVDSPLAIGASGSGTGSQLLPVSGSLDEAAIYASATTPSQIATNWNNGGFVPGAPTNVVATTAANYQASLSWSPPAYTGTSAITGYSITGQVGQLQDSPITVDATSTSVNIPNLSGGATYTFTVAATNSAGTGAGGTSNPLTITMPPAPALGQHLQVICLNTSLPFGGFSLTSGPMTLGAQWTIEGWMWGFSSNADTGGNSAWGMLADGRAQIAGGRTVVSPSVGIPNAGIEMRTGSSPLGSYFVWPGGTYPIPSMGVGFPDAPTPTHYALDYDGTTVRGFINGNLLFSQASSSAGGVYGWPGFSDQQEMRTASFDEFRISSVARYTANFTTQTTNFPDNEANTAILWHFDDHPIGQTYSDFVYTNTNFDWSHAVKAFNIPATVFRDSSGNGNTAVLYSWGSGQITGGFPMIYFVFSLAQGQSIDPSEVRSPSEPQQSACESGNYPVNCSTGEFWHTFADMAIPGRGLPLSLTRTYSSLHASSNGPLGYGWTNNYNMSLTFDGGGNATVHEENWSAVAFPVNGSGGYQPSSHVFATLVKNGDGTYTFSRKNQVHYLFDSAGRLVRETDRNGYATVLAYNGSGQLASVTDPANRALTFSYNPNGTLATVMDPTSRTVSFLYDASGNLSQVTDVGNGLTKFTYDTNHFMLTMKDPNCSATPTCNGVINVFDGGGRVTKQTDPMGRQTTYSYGATTVIHDGNGNETDERYINGLLMTRTRGVGTPQQATWTYSYDPVTLAPIAIIDPNGHSMAMSYDSAGNSTGVTDPKGRTTKLTYTSFNDPQTATDPLNVTTTYGYDGNGNLTSTSRPLQGTSQAAATAIAYDPAHAGDVLTMTDANNKVWQFTHDQYGDVASSTDPLLNTRTFSYDTIGRLTSVVSPKGNVTGQNPATYLTMFGYDPFGDLTLVQDPLSHTVRYVFDGNRNLTKLTDSNNNPTSYVYDSNNELTQVTRADTNTITYGYDGNGNVTQVQDGLTHPTTYVYDPLDRLASTTDSLSRKTSYTYDSLGNRATLVDPLGRTTTYGYDIGNQLTSISYSDGITPKVSVAYDLAGHRLSMTDGTGTTRYTYDSLDRLTQSTNGANQTVKYGYDLKSQLTSLTYPGGINTVTRAYDDAGRLHSVADWLNHTTTYQYDPNSNLTSQTYPNGVVASLSYDAADRSTGISDALGTNTAFLSLGYARDSNGQLTSENSQAYGYDAMSRLTSAGSTTYGYDPADRLTQITAAGGNTTNFVYDVANQLQSATTLNSGGAQTQKYTFGFDANGNRTSRTDQTNAVTSYQYDQVDRLAAIGTTITYAFDGAGLRQSKTVNGTPEAFTRDIGDALPLVIQDGTTSYVTGRGGLPLEQVSPTGTVLYYHQDQLGSTRALSDSGGNVVATDAYDAYGNLIGSTGAINNPFLFAGEYTDQESGFVYLRARFYDPATGSFLTRDPKGKAQTYAYAGGSPLNLIDPSGADANDSPGMQAGAHSKQLLTEYPLLNFVPVVGTTLNAFAAYRDAQCGNYFDAGMESFAVLPLFGLIGDAAKLDRLGAAAEEAGAARGFGPGAMHIDQPFDKSIERIYEGSPKHGAESYFDSSGRIVSRAPRGDAQAILDGSLPKSATSPHRIGVEPGTGLSVELRLTLRQELEDRIIEIYHGFVPGG